MRTIMYIFLAVALAISGCSKSPKFDGVWTYSNGKTLSLNKSLIEADSKQGFVLEMLGKLMDQLDIKDNKFIFGAFDKKMNCAINDAEKNNIDCTDYGGQKVTEFAPSMSIVDGDLHFVIPDEKGDAVLVFTKASSGAASSSKPAEEKTIAAIAPESKQDDKANIEQPSSPVAIEQKDINDTCLNDTKTIFSCTTNKGKRIEVCDLGSKISYSFGLPEKNEINIQKDRDSVTTTQWDGMGSVMSYSVNIPNGKTIYSVFHEANKNTQEVSSGVNVISGEKLLATVKCSESFFSNIEGIDLPQSSQ